jgi:hypothetical protein
MSRAEFRRNARRRPVTDTQPPQTPTIGVPAEFLAEHGRVSMENAQLRNALAQAQQTITMLVEKLRQANGLPADGSPPNGGVERDPTGLPVLRRRPNVVEADHG